MSDVGGIPDPSDPASTPVEPAAAPPEGSVPPASPPVAPPEFEAVAVAPVAVLRIGKTRNPWGVWLLSLVTLGIYALYWYYKINAELRDYDGRIQVEPVLSLLAVLFAELTLYIAAIISIVRTGGRIARGQEIAGRRERCSGLAGILLALISFGIVYYQSQINKIWDQYGNPPAGTPRPA
jgi:hypothetical protein